MAQPKIPIVKLPELLGQSPEWRSLVGFFPVFLFLQKTVFCIWAFINFPQNCHHFFPIAALPSGGCNLARTTWQSHLIQNFVRLSFRETGKEECMRLVRQNATWNYESHSCRLPSPSRKFIFFFLNPDPIVYGIKVGISQEKYTILSLCNL